MKKKTIFPRSYIKPKRRAQPKRSAPMGTINDCYQTKVSKRFKDARPYEEFYALVVKVEVNGNNMPQSFTANQLGQGHKKTTYSSWVSTTSDMLCTCARPILFSKEHLNDLRTLWKRSVIDNAIKWYDGGVLKESLKIVTFKLAMDDVTDCHFSDEDEYKEHREMVAMSKLTSEEALLLGVDDIMARYSLLKNDTFDRQDSQLISRLMKAQEDADPSIYGF